MAPLHRAPSQRTQTIHHFTHPQHPLQKVYTATEYKCHGCNTLGFGSRFRCPTCHFELHERCATCPFSLLSHLHPQHQLTLVNRPEKAHFCDPCGDVATGIFYTCGACDFDVHPLCSQLPLNIQHTLHPQHLFTLHSAANPSWCALCRHACTSWRYGCNVCHVDVHLECAVAPLPPPDGSGGAASQFTGTWAPPPPATAAPCGGYAIGVPTSQQSLNQGQASGNRKKIYSIVGKLAVKALVTSIIGVPVEFP